MRAVRLIALTAIVAWIVPALNARPKRRPVHSPNEDSKSATIAPGAEGPRVLRAQILLDRVRFSPGEIDGRFGDDLAIAVKGYQEAHNLRPTGVIDARTWTLLDRDRRPLFTRYTITEKDVKGPFTPIPEDVQEQAKMQWMGYESVEEELGERFHVAPKQLTAMNPGKDFSKAGTEIQVPDVHRGPAGRALRVVVSKSKRTVSAYGLHDRLLARYPATIGGPHDPLPIGDWKITSVKHDPWFFWDPEHFWNVDPDKATAKLPPGPNDPVGVVWMGLSKEHYGIHGTPDPGHVHHGESYGCIRLTNWDADDLSHMVRVGTPAILGE